MDPNDRFAAVVVACAALLTTVAFVAMHWDGLAGTRAKPVDTATRTTSAPEAHSSAPSQPAHEVRPAASDRSTDAGAVIPAVAESTPEPAGDQTARMVARTVAAVIRGASPELGPTDLPTMADVLVRRDDDGMLVVAAGTQRRYTDLVVAIGSLDPQLAAERLQAIAPDCELAMTELVPESAGFEQALRDALDRLISVEIPAEPVVLESRGVRWAFVDPGLEALDPAQKHLLLMGAEAQRTVRGKLVELREALGWAAPEPFQAGPDRAITRSPTPAREARLARGTGSAEPMGATSTAP